MKGRVWCARVRSEGSPWVARTRARRRDREGRERAEHGRFGKRAEQSERRWVFWHLTAPTIDESGVGEGEKGEEEVEMESALEKLGPLS